MNYLIKYKFIILLIPPEVIRKQMYKQLHFPKLFLKFEDVIKNFRKYMEKKLSPILEYLILKRIFLGV